MAESNITKRALADALRQLMKEFPFEKIQVAQICQTCGMNRKSFYYHFKDKYDLVNWIFDTDFAKYVDENKTDLQWNEHWDLIEQICNYFYLNKCFYKKALQIKGQNAFSDHLKEYCRPMLIKRLHHLCMDVADNTAFVDFILDAMISVITQWLEDKNDIPPEQFVVKIKYLVQKSASAIHQEAQNK